MEALIKQLLVLYIFIIVGVILGKWRKDMAAKSSLLSFLTVNLLLPSKTLLNFANNFTVSYLQNNYITIFISVGILCLLVLLGGLTGKVLSRKDAYGQKVYTYSVAVANYAYLGYVLVENALGEAALNDIMVFCVPFSIYCYTFGVSLLMDKKTDLKSLLTPTPLAIVVGIFLGLTGIRLPEVILTVAKNASAATGPVTMLLVGLVISGFTLKEILPTWESWAFSFVKLLLAPAMVFAICKLLGLFMTVPGSVYPSAVIMAAMPCGLNPVIYPRLIGKDCAMGAKLIPLTAILSMLTIPLWMYIMGL